jgi:hypothetical protein
MVLISQPLLESRTSAYLEWLVNELLMTTNKKIKYKDAPLVMLPAVAITRKPNSLAYPWSLLFLSDG